MVNRGMLMFVIPVFMKISLELTIAQIGLIVALFPITSGIGSLIGGTIADHINRRTVIYLFVTISMILSASLIFATTWAILAILYATISLFQGCYMAAKGALFMDNTNPAISATQFSIYMGIGNSGMALGESLGSILIPFVGFTGTFLYSAWFFSPGLLILYFIKTKKKNTTSINRINRFLLNRLAVN